MTDRPILFSAPMVRALLAGTKTQTRRLLSLRGHKAFSEFGPSDTAGYDWHFRDVSMRWHDLRDAELKTRLSVAAGDRLWVREAHYLTDDGFSEYAVFVADGEDATREHLDAIASLETSHPTVDWSRHKKLRSSIHMPRWASRLTLHVTDVRVQRLQDISDDDAKAEGITEHAALGPFRGGATFWAPGDGRTAHGARPTPVGAYKALWEEINGAASWALNPWVAAYTFNIDATNISQASAA